MFSIVGNGLYMFVVPDTVTKDCKKVYKSAIKNSYIVANTSVHTFNGVQTKNVINLLSNNTRKVFMQNTEEYLKSYYFKLESFVFDIYHIHMIHYLNGYQDKHNHSRFEDHSFILYLNNSEGCTRFYNDIRQVDVVPEVNKLIFFNSASEHEGLLAKDKMVLVGGIRVYKKWSQ